jgi:hypothetical protein
MKALLLAAALCAAGTTLASAQEFSVGPEGFRVRRDRDWDRDRWENRRWDYDRHRCRYVTVTEEDEDGDVVRRRIRRCD